MKKNLLLVCLALSIQSSMATTRSAVLLLHNGSATTFDNTQLSDAMRTAEHGDTIYLTEGAFDVDTLIIDKVVTMIGVGQETKIRGDIHIAVDDNPQTFNHFLDALYITGDVKLSKGIQGLKIRKCRINGFLWAAADIKDLQVDRCFISIFLPTSRIKSASFKNSYISHLGYSFSYTTSLCYSSDTSSKGNDLTFLNCSIYEVYASNLHERNVWIEDAGFLNCFIRDYIESSTWGSGNCYLTNTIVCKTSSLLSGNIIHHCYLTGNLSTWQLYNDVNKTIEAGYIGQDGTAVGYLGGSSPFSLTPVGVVVEDALLKVDQEKKQLNVTLKIKAHQ